MRWNNITTKQVSGLKIFLDIKRCIRVDNFVDDMGRVCSIDDDDAVFVLLMVDDDNVSSLSRKVKDDIFAENIKKDSY